MSFSSFISRRLSLRDGGRRLRPPAIIVAVGGVALSFVVMLLAIAVVTGFKAEISRKIMGFDAQIRVMPLASFYGDEDVAIALDGNLRQIIDSGLGDLRKDTSLKPWFRCGRLRCLKPITTSWVWHSVRSAMGMVGILNVKISLKAQSLMIRYPVES